MATNKRDLFVHSINMVPIGGRHIVPTSVWYSKDEFKAGDEAYISAAEPSQVCDNFKIQLGEQAHGSTHPREIKFVDGRYRSIHSIASDYLRHLVQQAETWIENQGMVRASRVLVAEPIAIHDQGGTHNDWLANYRKHIRRILEQKFEDVDFLPEPFAVFQYYRYGIRHPLVADKAKHIALVLDFGGGTFDISVIETTAAGDVSNSGRNSRPLAASSIAIGGFYFNRKIAEYLLFKSLPDKKKNSNIAEALRKYDYVRRDPSEKIEDLRVDYQNFYRHFSNLLFEVEKAKIGICSLIRNWSLDATPSDPVKYLVNVPSTPLAIDSAMTSIRLDEIELRKIFVENVWESRLRNAIVETLTKANTELDGQAISVVLLSGGSANIRWLNSLLKNFQHKFLPEPRLLQLNEDYQEIVAKGLAIECARKTFNDGDGDFNAVTYNRLCLALESDRRALELVKFRPENGSFGEPNVEGILLKSASILRDRVESPLSWKFRLSHPPRTRLDYFFMSSTFDPNDHTRLHNVIDHTIASPSNASFDSNLQLHLSVKEDGTATPKFIYRAKSLAAPSLEVEGRPFFIDMTFGGAAGSSEAYIGVDFGTSNSSVSYIDKASITTYTDRAKDFQWENINDLINILPYPIASPLASYVASNALTNLDLKAIAAIEAFLMYGAYIAYSEYRTIKPSKGSKYLKSFTQRSSGPLWALIRDCVSAMKGQGYFSKNLERLLEEPIYTELNGLVTTISQIKHDKSTDKPDYMRAIKLLGNIFSDFCGKFDFGYFENVQKKRFGSTYKGIFRCAIGPHIPFTKTFDYEGPHSLSEDQCVLLCSESKKLLRLAPLMFWYKSDISSASSDPELHYFDTGSEKVFSYKLAGMSGQLKLSGDEFEEIIGAILTLKNEDQALEILENFHLSK